VNIIKSKLIEVISAVLPITVLVLILDLVLLHMDLLLIYRFIIGTLLIIIGLTAFLLGVDIGISPIGNLIGSNMVKLNKVWLLALIGLFLGFIISIIEPDLHILAGQVELVSSGQINKVSLIVVVSIGIAAMVSLGLIRIVYNITLQKVLIVLYSVILILSFFVSKEFLAISFDSSGATTGAMTVPFLLALAIGISAMKKDSKASEKDSFGLIAIASAGAIIAVMVMSIITGTKEITGDLQINDNKSKGIFEPFIDKIPLIAAEIFIAIISILIIFIVLHKITFKLNKNTFSKILIGLAFTYIGLVLFLVGVNAGFMEIGSIVGYEVASLENKAILIILGFLLGLVTILAEPAVHVLTHEIEDVTSGYINRKLIMAFLSIGVGFAIGLSMLRIVLPELELWHLILPGYLIAMTMTFFAPKVFVGIAFDSGGVASGPMTATFILAFTQGAAEAIEGADVLVDGFGMIAMVALTPIIALQILGLIYKKKSVKRGVDINAK